MREKFSIWALPEKSTENDLQSIIIYLSLLYGGPIFQPHLTLIGDVGRDQGHMIEAAHLLAEDLEEFRLRLGEVSFSTTFFQSVFVRALATAQIMEKNLQAKKILRLENNVYMPHVSLLYGDHSMRTREEAMHKVVLTSNNFNVERFVLVPSTPDPSEWEILYQVDVRKNSDPLL